MGTLFDILNPFGDVSGLKINPAKSSLVPIRCDDVDLNQVLAGFGGQRVGFPMKYLVLAITLKRILLLQLQFILDRIQAWLPGWNGRFMSIAGRRMLVLCVLDTSQTYL